MLLRALLKLPLTFKRAVSELSTLCVRVGAAVSMLKDKLLDKIHQFHSIVCVRNLKKGSQIKLVI